ncbi:MAG: SpoIIE family protein phosphatase [Bryobacteraceae bacterium]|nr:SpoIIE family protein phosphatase [Bryobacteraceae bacterium]
MDVRQRLKWILSYTGRAEKAFAVVLAAYLVSAWLPVSPATRLLLFFVALVAGSWAAIKWLRILIQKVIWRLRNRLLVAYLFIALVPVLLVGIMAYLAGISMAAQVAVYLVSSEFDRRIAALRDAAGSFLRMPDIQRERAWLGIQSALSGSYPKMEILIRQRGKPVFAPNPAMPPPPDGYGQAAGAIVKDGLLYAWAHAVAEDRDVTILAPLDYAFFAGLAPGIGEVTIDPGIDSGREAGGAQAMRPHDPLVLGRQRRTGVPPAHNRFDVQFLWGVNVPVSTWETPPRIASGLLSVRSRMSAVLDVASQPEAQAGVLRDALYTVGIIFLVVELIALYIGVSLTRTITAAFDDLYQSTERVRQGDFTHRIQVRGGDQIATVSQSFNRMTENLQRLLAVAMEKERMQAELEIAREVQNQLYPRQAPILPKLELQARCAPARLVSGDYYDYQALLDSSAVVAIGDVAGKGISAALLMATLQSSLRTQVRVCLERAKEEGSLGLSASQLVRQLNLQLFADTSPEKYATFYFGIYDDSSGLLTYTNAGHLPPLLVRDGKASLLDVNGMVVGAFPFAQYGESQIQLVSGDLLVCYTDGVTEPENEYGEMFGEQRLIDVVMRNAERETGQVIEAVVEAVHEWTGSPELQDDMTLLVARRC